MNDKYNKENLEKIIKNSKSIKECLIKLDRPTSGDNYNFLKRKILKYGIDVSHFLSTKELRDLSLKERGKYFSKKFETKDIFRKNSLYQGTGNNLKKILFKEKLKKNQCEICGINDIWNGKKMSLHLDHINGDNKDNRLENLRILCPNCHACTHTYGGKNIKSNLIKKQKEQLKKDKEKQKIEIIKKQILEANIDFSKKTWGTQIAKIINTSPQYAIKFIKNKTPELLNTNWTLSSIG
jgi:hypothetical protein